MILVDSNVWIDVIEADPVWMSWSSEQIGAAAAGTLAINPIIFAEISTGFADQAALEAYFDDRLVRRLPLPFSAASATGRAYLEYRRQGGVRTSALADFYIGAHAAAQDLTLLTRDPRRYRRYFPGVELIAPSKTN